jgi:hypothetical protein
MDHHRLTLPDISKKDIKTNYVLIWEHYKKMQDQLNAYHEKFDKKLNQSQCDPYYKSEPRYFRYLRARNKDEWLQRFKTDYTCNFLSADCVLNQSPRILKDSKISTLTYILKGTDITLCNNCFSLVYANNNLLEIALCLETSENIINPPLRLHNECTTTIRTSSDEKCSLDDMCWFNTAYAKENDFEFYYIISENIKICNICYTTAKTNDAYRKLINALITKR